MSFAFRFECRANKFTNSDGEPFIRFSIWYDPCMARAGSTGELAPWHVFTIEDVSEENKERVAAVSCRGKDIALSLNAQEFFTKARF